MKFLAVFLALASPTHAALLANFQTDRGTVVVELQYQKAPQAVANFITMAQGTRSRVVQSTGAVTQAPMYVGEKFFRVINDPSFKIAQTGSGTGTNAGSTGFTFRDEFDPTLTHVPYVLSMANSGPNSNGSQIFFTGNVSIPSLNNVHTVFGLITDPASRAVLDAILAAGNNGTTTTGVTFSRTDPAAVAFDELAQNLPMVVRPSGSLAVNRNTAATWSTSNSFGVGSVFRAFRSTSLEASSWSELGSARKHIGLDSAAPASPVASILDDATETTAFYNLSLAQHPGSVTPSSLANRVVTFPFPNNSLIFAFDATGVAGTATLTFTSSPSIIGPFTTLGANAFEPNNLTFICDFPSITPQNLWFKIGCDTATSSLISGHHSTQQFTASGWQPFGSGPVTITR